MAMIPLKGDIFPMVGYCLFYLIFMILTILVNSKSGDFCSLFLPNFLLQKYHPLL